MELRGHGDIMGYQQSGIKNFRFADPIQHKDLFLLAEKSVKEINSTNIKRFENLLKFFDKADIINELEY
jgi:RecG-like helicase